MLKKLLRTLQDTVMRISNPCLTESTKQTETSTMPIPKAAPIGARLDSSLARQSRARKAVEVSGQDAHDSETKNEGDNGELEKANS